MKRTIDVRGHGHFRNLANSKIVQTSSATNLRHGRSFILQVREKMNVLARLERKLWLSKGVANLRVNGHDFFFDRSYLENGKTFTLADFSEGLGFENFSKFFKKKKKLWRAEHWDA